jgi:hypothetical protein
MVSIVRRSQKLESFGWFEGNEMFTCEVKGLDSTSGLNLGLLYSMV